jgi:putative transposase
VPLFKKLIKGQKRSAKKIVTDKLLTYGAARKVVMPNSMHRYDCDANNRAEVSHKHTRAQDRQIRGFKASGHAQGFLSVHGHVNNLFV